MVERRRKAPVFPGKDGGRLDFLKAARASSVRERGRESASRAAASREGEFPRPGATGSPHGWCAAKRENGGREQSKLRNQRRSVEGSATRSGSLTGGAAVSNEQPSRKRRRSAWLRAIRL